jgi:biopolymer transport protein ExbB
MVSPLLGLLGTVLGMIQSFQELEIAQGWANASVLAGGIWQALLTTAAGLIVAIPAAIAAQLLAARIESAGQLIESTVGQLYLIEATSRLAP